MLSVVILRVAFSIVTLNVILLNAIILIVVAPFEEAEVKEKTEGIFTKLLTLILRLFLCEGCFNQTRLPQKGLFTLSLRHPIQNIDLKKFVRGFVNADLVRFEPIYNFLLI